MASAARRQILGGGAPINKSRRRRGPQIVGGEDSISANTSLWSDALSGPTNVQHFVTALFHLLFTIMKSIMFFVLPYGD